MSLVHLPARPCRFLFHTIPLTTAATFLLIGVAINFANVIGRYIFSAAIYWAEEAMVYLAIWSIFLAAIAIAYDRAHLAMDFFSARLPKPWNRVSESITAIATVVVCLFMASQSMIVARTLVRNGQNSLALEIPMVVAQASLLVGFVMIAAAVMARLFIAASYDRAASMDNLGSSP
jgi:TRAP-type C4-dicarboxylate transport system permease small subunit